MSEVSYKVLESKGQIVLHQRHRFKGQKLVIPASMREEMIKAEHIGHLGVRTCVCHAHDIMFWLVTYVQADKGLRAWLHNLSM